MTGYGYTYGEFASGATNVNSFVYNFHKNWGVGLDIITTFGERETNTINTGNYIESTHDATTLSVGPNIYCFLLNNSKHQIFANAGVSYSYRKIYNLNVEYRENPNTPENKDLNFYGKDWGRHGGSNAFGMNVSTGYNYKLSDVFAIGARLYFNMVEDWYATGMLNLTMSF